MLAIILAGGEGKRLRPLTTQLPKALIPVQGKALVEHVVDLLRPAGVTDVILSTGYLSDKVRDYFARRDLGVVLRYLEESTPRGTAGPLMLLKASGQIPDRDFFLINGDNLLAVDLAAFARAHQRLGGVATMALTEVSDPSAFGVARLEGERIAGFVEKPPREEAPSHWVNSGYAVVSPAVFDVIAVKPFSMLERDVWPVLAWTGKLFAYRGQGQWFDTGTPEQYARVRREWRGFTYGI